MFLPPDFERKRKITKWVAAAMNATTLVQLKIASGELPISAVQQVLANVLNEAVKEISAIPSVHSEPSLN